MNFFSLKKNCFQSRHHLGFEKLPHLNRALLAKIKYLLIIEISVLLSRAEGRKVLKKLPDAT